MPADQVVLQFSPRSAHPEELPFRQHRTPISPLPATLTSHPATAANKRLTENLTPLDATLTKKQGEGPRHNFSSDTKFHAPPCFHSLTNCPFSIPFVLTFMHVMGGCTPLPFFVPDVRTSQRSDVRRSKHLPHRSIAPPKEDAILATA